MNVRRSISFGIVALLFVLGSAGGALAASVSGRASTVLEWYDDAGEDTAVPVYQYLQLNARDLAEGWHFRGYGRLGDDLADEVDADSRLYYAYLEKRDLMDNLDLRLGRQFISTTAGASLMDGIRFDYAFLDDYRLTLFGGGDVTYYEGYNVKDVVAGVEVGGRFFEDLDVEGSYLQKWDGGLLAQELLGLDLSYDWDGRLWLYSETQWDILSERLSYAQLGGKYRFAAPWTLRLEYLYSLPVFSSTSIYSVFAVEDYEEVLAEATWRVRPGWQTFARYVRELYDEFDDADVVEAGIEKLRTGRYSGYLSGIYRKDDDGQDLSGFKVRAACKVIPTVEAGVGMNLDVLEREIDYFDGDGDGDETTNRRYWADVTWEISDKLNLQGKVERVESDLWDYYNRGRVRLNFLF